MKPLANLGSAILLVFLAILLGGDWLGERFRSSPAPAAGARGRARVERTIDGDTVVFSEGLGTSRLVGVDTPETVKPGMPVECFGAQASAFTGRILRPGRSVRYRVAREPVDAYGRALVYVWLPDRRFFNAMLVRRGYARPLAIAPNLRYAPLLLRLANRANRAERGLWSRSACGRG
jgi:micrococcal nuclease